MKKDYLCIIALMDPTNNVDDKDIIWENDPNVFIMNKNIWKRYMHYDPDILTLFICTDEKFKDDELYYNENTNTLTVSGKHSIRPGLGEKFLKSIKFINENFNYKFLFRATLNTFLIMKHFKNILNNYGYTYTTKQIRLTTSKQNGNERCSIIQPLINFNIFKFCNNVQSNDPQLILYIDTLNNNPNMIYSLKTFYNNYPEFDYYTYRELNKEKFMNMTEVEVILYWLNNKTVVTKNLKYHQKNILIYPHIDFNLRTLLFCAIIR